MIELKKVSLQQGNFQLNELDFQVSNGQYAILMGPTGCGKTTVLEAICGLRRVKSGKIFVAGREVTWMDAAGREIGYVPQDRSLFPAMRIDKQIEYGLLVRNASVEVRRNRVAELAELTGISHLLDRYPQGLSGGEQQRVALARACISPTSYCALDEPLASFG